MNIGDAITGMLVDGDAATPFLAATLRLEAPRGLTVEVPYIEHRGDEQFASVRAWFERQQVPRSLLFVTTNGRISLSGCRFAGRLVSSGNIAQGTIAVAEALMSDRDCNRTEPIAATKCASRIDNLAHWTRLSAYPDDPPRKRVGATYSIDIHIEAPAPIEFCVSSGATVRVRSDWQISHDDAEGIQLHTIKDRVVIETEFPEPAEFSAHLTEHNKLRCLIALMYGKAAYFREHRMWDSTITLQSIGGEVLDHPYVELISSRTVGDRARPVLEAQQRGLPLLGLNSVGPRGLKQWSENFDSWHRFITPVASMMGRPNRTMEDAVIAAAMSLEAAGRLLGKQVGEEQTYARGRQLTTTTWIYRCIRSLDIRWGKWVASELGLAGAIAKNYNAIKHSGKGGFPEVSETFLIGQTAETIARLVAAKLTGAADSLLQDYRSTEHLWQLDGAFHANGREIVDDEGTWSKATD